MGEARQGDENRKQQMQQFIQAQTSAMIRLKTFAESRGIAIPFSGPEKTKESVRDLQEIREDKKFDEAWIKEIKKLQHKLKTDLEGYRKKADDSALLNLVDSTLLMVRSNSRIIDGLSTENFKESI
jgi:hypothetical protein